MNSYSGKFVLRLTSKRHRELVNLAHQNNCSLNQLCSDFIEAGIEKRVVLPAWRVWFEKQLPMIQKKWGENLLGIAIFGSRADDTATQNSDIDVLVCLKSQHKISRSLYSWWDEHIYHEEFEYNPVFSHLPTLKQASGLWYEIALNHQILYDWQNALESTCAQLMQRVQNGQVQRKWSQGQPYWLLESAG